MVNIRDLIDDAKCFQTVRQMRWPDRVACPLCSSESVIKHGRDDTQTHRQRYLCQDRRPRFDDLTGTIVAGHHEPLHLGFFGFIHNVRARGKNVLGARLGLLVAPPRNPA